ncbi:hypothetical protein ACFY0N_00815 [Streptomyces vinaceus]|uniref:hypothetical protein n=1 Tax=Streptomyces vinaceus TaxID=1960 RepID=UPI0036CBA71F
MNPDPLPLLAECLRKLGGYPDRYDVTNHTLTEIAAELEQARVLVAQARGQLRTNRCVKHPGSPVDPDADNGCLFCGNERRPPARPIPEGFVPGEVLAFLAEHGHDAATERFGAQAVAKALSLRDRHPSNRRPGPAAGPYDEQGEQH